MLSSRLHRLVSSRAYALVTKSQKHSARKVLETQQTHVAASLKNDHDPRISSANTRALVNRFLQAVFTHDLAKSLELLKRFRSMEHSPVMPHGSSIYLCCFITLLNHVIELPKLNMIQLRETLNEYGTGVSKAEVKGRRGESKNEPGIRNIAKADSTKHLPGLSNGTEEEQVKILIVIAILKGLASVHGVRGQRISALNLIGYVRDMEKHHAIDQNGVLKELRRRRLELVREFNIVFHREEDPSVQLDAGLGLEQFYLQRCLSLAKGDAQFLDFDGLCEFILNSRYEDFLAFKATASPGTNAQQLHSLYDSYKKSSSGTKTSGSIIKEESLCAPEEPRVSGGINELSASTIGGQESRDQDHAHDTEFHYQKQLLLEQFSQSVYRNMAQSHNIMQFEHMHQTWIRDWHKTGTLHVQQSAELAKQHAVLHEHFLADIIVSLTLSHMLSSTLRSRQAKVLSVAKAISWSLASLIRNDKKLSKTHQLHAVVFAESQLLEFACHIIHLLIQALEMPPTASFIRQGSPALFEFSHVRDDSKNKRHGALAVNAHIFNAFKNYQLHFQSGSYDLPMVHRPKAWVDPQKGGFLSTPLSLVKSSEPNALAVYFSRAHDTGQLASVYQALNAMGTVPWTINPYILRTYNKVSHHEAIVQKLFKAPLLIDKIVMGKIPPRPRPEDYATEKAFFADYSAWKVLQKTTIQAYNDAVNLCINYNLVKQLANAYCGQTFYLPHTADFRGRVYPAVSFLSYQGDDLSRALMMFGEGRPLGPHGYDWIQYQLANAYSKTKMDMQQATRFVQEHRAQIQQSCQEPIDQHLWWLKADKPWQSLALCRELVQIWAFAGDVADYRSHMPIHQDGSCNGLQHYSALGGDVEAAKSVNVLPGEQRQDVYVTVLELVRNRIQNDHHTLAPMALGLLSRKLIKQTVMTTVYGVTPFGATRQIHRQVMELAEAKQIQDPIEKKLHVHMRVASYIAAHVLSSISELFAGAKKIQEWLVENCHRCIMAFEVAHMPGVPSRKRSTSQKQGLNFFDNKRWRPMMWTSLSGFPVVQLYRHRELKSIKTPLQSLTLRDDAKMAPIDLLKSRNGIAPNFIHSIDAMHLKMTCLAAQEKNITFVGVHDSFWTHAASVESLSKVLRQEFVRLHSSEIIENLRDDLAHLNRDSFQLVWVNKRKHGRFVAALSDLRKTYSADHEVSKTGATLLAWNSHLNTEIKDNLHVQHLVDKLRPQLLFRVRGSRHTIVYSESRVVKQADSKISRATHVPILVPVKILEAPGVGSLDIQKVLDSTFFFL